MSKIKATRYKQWTVTDIIHFDGHYETQVYIPSADITIGSNWQGVQVSQGCNMHKKAVESDDPKLEKRLNAKDGENTKDIIDIEIDSEHVDSFKRLLSLQLPYNELKKSLKPIAKLICGKKR
jgi:hypothetical protein